MTGAALSITTVRHSTTAHNATQVISGRLDEPLSDAGRTLAAQLRDEIGPIRADAIVASPMRRTIETATIIAGVTADDIVESDLCVERDYGELQGISAEAVRGYADRIDYIEVGGIRHSLNPPGGESFERVRERAIGFLDFLLGLDAESVLVVTHQVFLQQLHGMLLGLDVHPALGLDIRTLEVNRFALAEDGSSTHTRIHPGLGTNRSW